MEEQYRCGALRERRSAPRQAAGRVQRQPSTATATAFFLLGLPKQPIRCHRCPASAERAALRLGHQLSGHPCAGHRRGLTPRSSRAPTAGHAGPAGGTLYIFASRARASHRRCLLNSNVRPHQKRRVRQVRQSSVRGANSRKNRVRQGRASAAIGGIGAPLHQPSSLNGLRFPSGPA